MPVPRTSDQHADGGLGIGRDRAESFAYSRIGPAFTGASIRTITPESQTLFGKRLGHAFLDSAGKPHVGGIPKQRLILNDSLGLFQHIQ